MENNWDIYCDLETNTCRYSYSDLESDYLSICFKEHFILDKCLCYRDIGRRRVYCKRPVKIEGDYRQDLCSYHFNRMVITADLISCDDREYKCFNKFRKRDYIKDLLARYDKLFEVDNELIFDD